VLTEAEAAPRLCDEETRRREYVHNYARAQARREFIRRQAAGLFGGSAQPLFEQLLQDCDKDAAAIAREAAEEAIGRPRSAPGVVACEVAYVEAYTDALLALVASEMVRRDLLNKCRRYLEARGLTKPKPVAAAETAARH
jgi:hypothetical protein